MAGLLEVAGATWPAGLGFAAFAAARTRDTRRRESANRALHELRRPLHALVLGAGSANGNRTNDAVESALVALGDLDSAINGATREVRRRPVAARHLVESAVERWRPVAAARRRALTLDWRSGSASVLADPRRVAQALDNLVANALEHGGLRVRVWSCICARGVRIAVADGDCSGRRRRPPWRTRVGKVRDPRRGHGLAVVAAIAAEHGGRYAQWRSSTGSIAVLELPLAPVSLPAAASALEASGAADRPTLRRAA